MSEILWSPTWVQSPEFVIPRQYNQLLVVGWQDGFFVSVGNPLIIQEYPYGGYKLVIKLYDDFWNFQSASWKFQDVFEDVYAIHPTTGEHVNVGSVTLRWNLLDPVNQYGILLDFPALDNHYYFTALPDNPSDYWFQPKPPTIPLPYIYNP